MKNNKTILADECKSVNGKIHKPRDKIDNKRKKMHKYETFARKLA